MVVLTPRCAYHMPALTLMSDFRGCLPFAHAISTALRSSVVLQTASRNCPQTTFDRKRVASWLVWLAHVLAPTSKSTRVAGDLYVPTPVICCCCRPFFASHSRTTPFSRDFSNILVLLLAPILYSSFFCPSRERQPNLQDSNQLVFRFQPIV